ncbi:MAG: formate--tetrahydrofolate ligase [Bacilli bacterium]|nr:formate--tetrahydrofolate ligase [Bacilli bacterium]
MLSDIEIIKQSQLKPIREVIQRYDLKEEELFSYGNYIAKVEHEALKRLDHEKDGKLILVSAITPTPAGEGKSTTTIGLVDALNRLGKRCVGALREPSLGPVFGVKGGAAGGGYAQVNPMAELNLHFTGDIHAVTAANNLVSAILDNHLYQGNELHIDPAKISWKRCMDLNDRALRSVTVGQSSVKEVIRQDSFNISVASEIMAILCLSNNLVDLRRRLTATVVAKSYEDKPITIGDLGIVGSLLVLLKDALKPNIVQTLENNLMFVHGGPFANIAHGCNSIQATRLALKMSDYVVTEAGFGVDLGAEKFLDIKCREAGLKPNLVVVVATIRALKYHGGIDLKKLKEENLEALQKGLANLEKHLETVATFHLPAVVALNRFDSDTEKEIGLLLDWAKEKGVPLSLSEVHGKGSLGGVDLANKVLENLSDETYRPLYELDEDVFVKIKKIATQAYGADDVTYSEEALQMLKDIAHSDYKNFYICMAKTQNSLSDNPKVIGRPKNFNIHVKEVRLATGSRFIICLTGDIMTMPGLGKTPQAMVIELNDQYEIFGLM